MAKAPAAVQAKEPEQLDLIEKIEETPVEVAAPVEEAPQVDGEEPEAIEDASAALQKQVEALKKSEEIQKTRAERYRQEAEQAKQAAQDRLSEIDQVRKSHVQAELTSVNTALNAAKEASESAKRDIRTAESNGDVEAKIEAYDRLGEARWNISKLEEGKYELEERIKNPPKVEEPTQRNTMPERIQRWINDKRPDQQTWNRMRIYHDDIIRDGIEFDSDEYLQAMEGKLGWRKEDPADEAPVAVQQRPQQRTSIVSAPVSREAPSTPTTDRSSSQVKLTPAQRESAKIAGVSEKVYAEQLVKINKMKANGTYGGQ